MNLGDSFERKSERGVVAILMAVGIVVVLGFAAFAIDIGSALVTKAELQNVSDASSLAAARELALIYKDLGTGTDYKTYPLTSSNQSRILTKATQYATANKAGGTSISVLSSDLLYGTYDSATGAISQTTTGVRALRVVARRDENANGQLQTTLGRVLGVNQLSVTADSAAAITALGTLKAGKGDVPFAISEYWFDQKSCETDPDIRFYPTGDLAGCAGWHTFDQSPANANTLGKILDGLKSGSYQSPETTAGLTEYIFTGGTVSAGFSDLKDLYDSKKDAEGNWHVNIPVYEASDCSNPQGLIKVVGFARANITKVADAPRKTIDARVECGIFDAGDLGEGGGPNDFGTLVGTPGMIQ